MFYYFDYFHANEWFAMKFEYCKVGLNYSKFYFCIEQKTESITSLQFRTINLKKWDKIHFIFIFI